MKIHTELPVREQTCSHCKVKITKIKDYRTQIIKDIPIRFKSTLLSHRKRRYLCIDEFKGNTGYYKYQVSLMNGKTKKPIDIIECKYKTHLLDYFNKFSLQERKKVKQGA